MFLMVSKNLILFFRHKILNMLTKNPPFTKNMESPLCNEALVDQLWKLMNSGKAAVAFKVYYCNIFILVLKELWLFFFLSFFFFKENTSQTHLPSQWWGWYTFAHRVIEETKILMHVKGSQMFKEL